MSEPKLNQQFMPVKKSSQQDIQKMLQSKISDTHIDSIQITQNKSFISSQKIKLPQLITQTHEIEYSETVVFPRTITKIRNQQDRITIKLQKDLEEIQDAETVKVKQQIKKSSTIDQILRKQPLRKRYRKLLPDYLAFPIGSNNQKLIQKMIYIDRAIDFCIQNKNSKMSFLDEVKKIVLETMQQCIQLKDLLRILFIDPQSYQISWEKNQRIGNYDLSIKNISGQSQEERKQSFRKKLFQYLKKIHSQFLKTKDLQVQQHDYWHPEFQLQLIKIPMVKLPIHPKNQDQQEINLSQFNQTNIVVLNQIQNQNSNNFQKTIPPSIIHSKVNHDAFINELHNIILQKQKELKQQKQMQFGQYQQINNKGMKQIIEQVMAVYDQRGFQNIFLINVIQSVHQKLNENYSKLQIEQSIKKLLGGQINFLSELKFSNKGIILKINKDKYHEILDFYNE